jgi:hypothetical protein
MPVWLQAPERGLVAAISAVAAGAILAMVSDTSDIRDREGNFD